MIEISLAHTSNVAEAPAAASSGLGVSARPRFPWQKAFSFPLVLAALLVAGGFAGRRLNLDAVIWAPAGSTPEFFFQGDMWLHIRTGADILRTHHWPAADAYSFSAPGKPWVPYEWLGAVALALVDRAAGLTGLMALFVALTSLVLLLLYYYAWLRSGSTQAAFVACALLLPLASLSFTLRPQLFGYVFLLVTLIALERFRQGRGRLLWGLPVLMVVWVNTHATFFWGLAALAVVGLSGLASFRAGGLEAERWSRPQRRQLAIVGALSLAALGATPYGLGLVKYLMHLAGGQPLVTANFAEWLPLDFSQFAGKMLLGLLLLFALDLLVYRPAWRLDEIALLFIASFEAAEHGRFVLLFVPVFAPLLAMRLSAWLPPYKDGRNRPVLNAALVALLALAMIKFFPARARLQGAMEREFPLAALGYIHSHAVPGPMWNNPGWGGYMVYAGGPHPNVFIDGRLDFYEQAGVLSDFIETTRVGPGALAALDKYGIRSVLTEAGSPLGALLAARPDWKLVYHDALAEFYTRETAPPAEAASPR